MAAEAAVPSHVEETKSPLASGAEFESKDGSGAGAGVSMGTDEFPFTTPELKAYLEKAHADCFCPPPERAGELVTIDCIATAREALKVLLDKNISSAPVYLDTEHEEYTGVDEFRFSASTVHIAVRSRRYLGFVDVMDLTALALQAGLDDGKDGVAPKKSERTIMSRLARWFKPDRSEMVAAAVNLSRANPYLSVPPTAPLREVFAAMANGYHRVAVEDPKSGAVVGIATQSRMLRVLTGHRVLLGELGKAQVGDVFPTDPRYKEVHCISELAPAMLAYRRMLELRVSGLPLLDTKSRMVTNISASDIRSMGALDPADFDILKKSSIDFVSAMRKKREERVIKNGGRPGPLAPSNGGVRRCVSVSPTDTFGTLLSLFAFSKLHRVYILDGDHCPIGVVTITDMLRAVARGSVPAAPSEGVAESS